MMMVDYDGAGDDVVYSVYTPDNCTMRKFRDSTGTLGLPSLFSLRPKECSNTTKEM